jgi:AsmA protein
MNKILKFIVIGFSVAFLVIVSLIAYISYAFDPNQFKAQITQIVLEKKQRTLEIEGEIKLRFFPKLGVELGKVSLSARNSTAPFAKLESAHVSLALLPLISKRLVIDKIALNGLDLHFQRNVKGESNLDDLLSKDQNSGDSQKLQFDIEGVELTKANIQVSDAQTEFIGGLKNLNLTIGQIADKTPTSVKFSSQIISQVAEKITTDSQLDFKTGLRFDLEAQQFDVDKLDLTLKGLVQGKTLNLNIKAQQALNNPKTFSFKLVGLDANLQTRLSQGDLNISVNVPSIKVDQANASSEKISASVSLSGEQNLTAKLNTSVVSGTSKALKVDVIQIDVERKQGAQSVKANLQTNLQADLQQLIFNLSKLNINLEILDPSLAQASIKIPINGSLNANIKQQSIQTELQSQFDESKLQTTISVQGFGAPTINLNAAIDSLNVDRYIKTPPQSKSSEVSNKQSAQAETPIDLSALKALQLNGKIDIGKLQVKNLKLNALQIPFRLSDGKLELKGLQAQLYQGELRGDASVNANDNGYAVQYALSNIQIQPLLKDALNKDILEGRGSLKLNLQTQGNTVTTIKNSLRGDIETNLVDGAVKGFNIAKSLRDFKAKILNKTDQQQGVDSKEKTDFSAMSASLHFIDGIGKSDDLNMKSPFLRGGGSGTVNLRESTLDYLAKVTVVNSATGQDGADLSQLKDISIPIRISGPFDQLSYKIQFAQIGSDALKSAFQAKAAPALEEKKKELKEKVNEQLKDKLKGLFSR